MSQPADSTDPFGRAHRGGDAADRAGDGPENARAAGGRGCRLAVIGSINMDLVMRTPRFPDPGETILGGPFTTAPGGKGANQAIAAARLGAEVVMLGRVGADAWGAELSAFLRAEGVAVFEPGPGASSPAASKQVATGTALITVSDTGENTIVVAPGANATLVAADVDDLIAHDNENLDALLMQLEVPLEAIARAVETVRTRRKMPSARTGSNRNHGVADPFPKPFLALNAAPAPPADRPLPPTLLRDLDLLIVNETEARQVLMGVLSEGVESAGAGADGATLDARRAAESALASEDAAELAHALLAVGPNEIALTLGADGAIAACRRRITSSDSRDASGGIVAGSEQGETETAYQPAFRVEVVDTTAAGDAFAAAYVVQRACGMSAPDALRYACAAGAIAATRLGAAPSLPTADGVAALVAASPADDRAVR